MSEFDAKLKADQADVAAKKSADKAKISDDKAQMPYGTKKANEAAKKADAEKRAADAAAKKAARDQKITERAAARKTQAENLANDKATTEDQIETDVNADEAAAQEQIVSFEDVLNNKKAEILEKNPMHDGTDKAEAKTDLSAKKTELEEKPTAPPAPKGDLITHLPAEYCLSKQGMTVCSPECTSNDQCSSGSCNTQTSKCSGLQDPGYACSSAKDCQNGAACIDHSCSCFNNGCMCSYDENCQSGYCYKGICTIVLQHNGATCSGNSDCLSNYCVSGICTDPGYTTTHEGSLIDNESTYSTLTGQAKNLNENLYTLDRGEYVATTSTGAKINDRYFGITNDNTGGKLNRNMQITDSTNGSNGSKTKTLTVTKNGKKMSYDIDKSSNLNRQGDSKNLSITATNNKTGNTYTVDKVSNFDKGTGYDSQTTIAKNGSETNQFEHNYAVAN